MLEENFLHSYPTFAITNNFFWSFSHHMSCKANTILPKIWLRAVRFPFRFSDPLSLETPEVKRKIKNCLKGSLSIRRFWGKGEKWKRKRKRGEGKKSIWATRWILVSMAQSFVKPCLRHHAIAKTLQNDIKLRLESIDKSSSQSSRYWNIGPWWTRDVT